jgi:hypothetical protein
MYVIYYVLVYHTITIIPPYPLPPIVCNMICIGVSYNNYHSIIQTLGDKGYGGKIFIV